RVLRVLHRLAAAGGAGELRAGVARVDEICGNGLPGERERRDHLTQRAIAHPGSASNLGRNAPGVSAGPLTCSRVPPVLPAKNDGVDHTLALWACWSETAIAFVTSSEPMSASIFFVSKPGIDAPIGRSRSSVPQPEFSAPWLL